MQFLYNQLTCEQRNRSAGVAYWLENQGGDHQALDSNPEKTSGQISPTGHGTLLRLYSGINRKVKEVNSFCILTAVAKLPEKDLFTLSWCWIVGSCHSRNNLIFSR